VDTIMAELTVEIMYFISLYRLTALPKIKEQIKRIVRNLFVNCPEDAALNWHRNYMDGFGEMFGRCSWK
jgi:hypothetical protein